MRGTGRGVLGSTRYEVGGEESKGRMAKDQTPALGSRVRRDKMTGDREYFGFSSTARGLPGAVALLAWAGLLSEMRLSKPAARPGLRRSQSPQ